MKPPCAIATVQHRGSSGTTGGRYSVRFSSARMRSICCTRCGCWALISWCSVGSARMLYKPARRHRQRAAGQSKGFAGRTASGAVHHGGAWQATGAIDTRRAVWIDGASPAILIGRPPEVERRPTCNELVVALDQRVGREVQPGARGCRVGPDDHRPHADRVHRRQPCGCCWGVGGHHARELAERRIPGPQMNAQLRIRRRRIAFRRTSLLYACNLRLLCHVLPRAGSHLTPRR